MISQLSLSLSLSPSPRIPPQLPLPLGRAQIFFPPTKQLTGRNLLLKPLAGMGKEKSFSRPTADPDEEYIFVWLDLHKQSLEVVFGNDVDRVWKEAEKKWSKEFAEVLNHEDIDLKRDAQIRCAVKIYFEARKNLIKEAQKELLEEEDQEQLDGGDGGGGVVV